MSYHLWTVEALGCRYCSRQTMLGSHLHLCCSSNFGRKTEDDCLEALKESLDPVVVAMLKVERSPRRGDIC